MSSLRVQPWSRGCLVTRLTGRRLLRAGDELVFPQIAIVRVHVSAASGFPNAVARPAVGCTVTVETEQPMTGSITVDVDSSEPSPKFDSSF